MNILRRLLCFSIILIIAVNVNAETGAGNMDQSTNKEIVLITIGTKVFEAEVIVNKTSDDFLNRLPLTLEMKDLNSNEKFFYFKDKLPANSLAVKSIKSGDLLLYGDDCLVLFYKSFTTTYAYTRIANIINTEGLANALGSGTVKITFRKK